MTNAWLISEKEHEKSEVNAFLRCVGSQVVLPVALGCPVH